MRARSWVLQILYAWESQGGRRSLVEVMEATFRERRVAPERRPLIREHVETLQAHLPEIDRTIEHSMENWRMERLPRIDRAVLRLGVGELLFAPSIPAPVAIQEAIRLAGQYGSDPSPRFVNGVLDAVHRSRRGEGDGS